MAVLVGGQELPVRLSGTTGRNDEIVRADLRGRPDPDREAASSAPCASEEMKAATSASIPSN
jgi:hypothetical protein